MGSVEGLLCNLSNAAYKPGTMALAGRSARQTTSAAMLPGLARQGRIDMLHSCESARNET